MRKSMQVAVTLLLALVMVVMNINVASAKKNKSTSASIGDPTVVFVSGDKEFSTVVVSTADISGTTTLDNGTLVPMGFPTGEKQFEGSALLIHDFDQGKITLCFPFTGKSVGWGGKVGYWNGSAWQLLDTAISTPEESNVSLGCATASASGQYAFIKWVVDASMLPKEEKPACTFKIDRLLLFTELTDLDSAGVIINRRNLFLKGAVVFTTHYLAGLAGQLTFLDSFPDGAVSFDGKTKNVLLADDSYTKLIDDSYSIPFVKPIEVIINAPFDSMHFRFDFSSCYIDYVLEAPR